MESNLHFSVSPPPRWAGYLFLKDEESGKLSPARVMRENPTGMRFTDLYQHLEEKGLDNTAIEKIVNKHTDATGKVNYIGLLQESLQMNGIELSEESKARMQENAWRYDRLFDQIRDFNRLKIEPDIIQRLASTDALQLVDIFEEQLVTQRGYDNSQSWRKLSEIITPELRIFLESYHLPDITKKNVISDESQTTEKIAA